MCQRTNDRNHQYLRDHHLSRWSPSAPHAWIYNVPPDEDVGYQQSADLKHPRSEETHKPVCSLHRLSTTDARLQRTPMDGTTTLKQDNIHRLNCLSVPAPQYKTAHPTLRRLEIVPTRASQIVARLGARPRSFKLNKTSSARKLTLKYKGSHSPTNTPLCKDAGAAAPSSLTSTLTTRSNIKTSAVSTEESQGLAFWNYLGPSPFMASPFSSAKASCSAPVRTGRGTIANTLPKGEAKQVEVMFAVPSLTSQNPFRSSNGAPIAGPGSGRLQAESAPPLGDSRLLTTFALGTSIGTQTPEAAAPNSRAQRGLNVRLIMDGTTHAPVQWIRIDLDWDIETLFIESQRWLQRTLDRQFASQEVEALEFLFPGKAAAPGRFCYREATLAPGRTSCAKLCD